MASRLFTGTEIQVRIHCISSPAVACNQVLTHWNVFQLEKQLWVHICWKTSLSSCSGHGSNIFFAVVNWFKWWSGNCFHWGSNSDSVLKYNLDSCLKYNFFVQSFHTFYLIIFLKKRVPCTNNLFLNCSVNCTTAASWSSFEIWCKPVKVFVLTKELSRTSH